ncbi:TlpA family protein disulfide reductase [Pseudoduganella sp. GCM10020061]|uniref:TlpA family protein disulfide reductase n=1 Tax=Pseudoduganella sp. GCM10020061 TaxID=3317345 RepID=UPI003631DB6B
MADTPSKSKWSKPAAIAAVVLALGGIGFAAFTGSKPAPEVTYLSIKGEQITPAALKGKVVMVNFWATSCVTCVKEMPDMVRTYEKFKGQGLEFIAVAMSYDPPNYVVNFTETRKLPFKVALDVDGSAAKAFGDVQLTPTTFVIGRDGKILKRYVGEPDFAELDKLIQRALST